MKKTFSFLLFLVIALTSSAQDSLKHLCFNEVPIDGNLADCFENVRKSGLRPLYAKQKVAVFSGEFEGYKECLISLHAIEDQGLVNRIIVCLPFRQFWSELLDDYTKLKAALCKKYGEPEFSREQFRDGLEPTTDEECFELTKNKKNNYATSYKLSGGDVSVAIITTEKGCCVAVGHTDRINTEKAKLLESKSR